MKKMYTLENLYVLQNLGLKTCHLIVEEWDDECNVTGACECLGVADKDFVFVKHPNTGTYFRALKEESLYKEEGFQALIHMEETWGCHQHNSIDWREPSEGCTGFSNLNSDELRVYPHIIALVEEKLREYEERLEMEKAAE